MKNTNASATVYRAALTSATPTLKKAVAALRAGDLRTATAHAKAALAVINDARTLAGKPPLVPKKKAAPPKSLSQIAADFYAAEDRKHLSAAPGTGKSKTFADMARSLGPDYEEK